MFIYVNIFLDSFCPPLDPPQGGSQQCEDWGPGGRFKVCRIRCDDGLRFSQPVPQVCLAMSQLHLHVIYMYERILHCFCSISVLHLWC